MIPLFVQMQEKFLYRLQFIEMDGKVLNMKRVFFFMMFALFAVCSLTFSMPLTSWASSASESDMKTATYLSEGDTQMFNGKLEDAQKIYESVLEETPNSYEALWRLSRLYISIGMAADKIKDKKKEWKKAEDYAKQAIEINPDAAEGHIYLAISIGKRALLSSASEKIKSVWDIKKEAEKAMELDPTHQKAYLILGTWHRNVATASSMEKQLAKMFFGELPEGSLDESLKLLLKSISLGGNEVKNYYELALTYEELGNYEAAKKEYENALNARSLYPEDSQTKEKIKKVLSKSRYKIKN